ncbi:MAG TPA: ABC transporter ATP-binding protein [Gemmatimonadales bacterium]|nr:ABC transporter ATP-binding protein [Gemmatimonadales bacterium]
MTAPAVDVRGLTRRFGELTAIDTLWFTVARGELFGIVGPDGAGKTTTLRMLAGVLRPTAGEALIEGKSVVQDPEGVKHGLAYMSQRFGLYTDLTVRENIDFYADLYGVPHAERPARLARLYEFSRLEPFEGRLAGNLSGGMKQKLSLCCALIHRPALLLLDEPTFGVDPISRRDLWLIIHQMVADGVTVIVSTSYLDEAERCDRVAMLHAGRLLALDRPETLQRRLAGRVIALTTDDPRRAVEPLRRLPGVRGAALFGERLHVMFEGAPGSPGEAARRIAGAGLVARDVELVEPSLEDTFIDLVTHPEAQRG